MAFTGGPFTSNTQASLQNSHVAAMRDVMYRKLELKTPCQVSVGPPCCEKSKKLSENPTSGKPFLGRVLEGPCDPNKYFQGVPPPNYGNVKYNGNGKIQSIQKLFINELESPPLVIPEPWFSKTAKKGELRIKSNEIDDSASIVSSCLSTVGDSSEVAAFSAAGEQNRLAEISAKKLVESQLNNTHYFGSAHAQPQRLVIDAADNKQLESTYVQSVTAKETDFNTNSCIPQETSRNDQYISSDHSKFLTALALESSHLLLKPRSPAPYSTDTMCHYGTIRKGYSKMKLFPTSFMHTLRMSSINGNDDDCNSEENNRKPIRCLITSDLPIDSRDIGLSPGVHGTAIKTNGRKRLKLNFGGKTLTCVKMKRTNSRFDHFHLPTYRFRDEDSRPVRCFFENCSSPINNTCMTPCMICRRPKKDISFHDIDRIFKKLTSQKSQHLSHDTLDIIRVAENIEKTVVALDAFLLKLDKAGKRSKSQPIIQCSQGDNKFPKDLRQLENGCDEAKMTALHLFKPENQKEMALDQGQRGDVTLRIDDRWQVQTDESYGIFPKSCTLLDEFPENGSKLKSVFAFEGRGDAELSLRKGEILTMRRKVDSNWLEVSNKDGIIGIFPSSYVEPFDDLCPSMNTEQPERNVKINAIFKDNSEESSNILTVNQDRTFEKSTKSCLRQNAEKTKVYSENPLLPVLNSAKNVNFIGTIIQQISPSFEIYQAVYSYIPKKEDELRLAVSDIIILAEKCDDGWFIGTSVPSGKFGIFPGNYVKKC